MTDEGFCNDTNSAKTYLGQLQSKNYNYVVVFAEFNSSYNSTNITRNRFQKVFSISQRYGIRVIPGISFLNCWADNWRNIRNNISAYSNMQMNRARGRNRGGTIGFWGMPAVAPDNVFDNAFTAILNAINTGKTLSGVTYPLEFIHIGGDEPSFYEYCLIGGVPDAISSVDTLLPINRSEYPIGTYCIFPDGREYAQVDRSFIDSLVQIGLSRDKAVLQLYTAAVFRKIQQIKSVFGNQMRMMMWGDMFDNQFNGTSPSLNSDYGYATYYSRSATLKFTPELTKLPGLVQRDRDYVKENFIPIIWNYDDTYCLIQTRPNGYLENVTFASLAGDGFRFIYGHSLEKLDNQNYTKQANDFAVASRKFRDNCMGFFIVNWDGSFQNKLNALEQEINYHSGEIPSNSFQSGMPKMINKKYNTLVEQIVTQ